MNTFQDDERWNSTNMIFTFSSGSRMEFFSADDHSKLRGARRDRLFINECNNIPKSAYDQLEIRTKGVVFLDWNPETKFWFHDKLQDTDNVFFDISTHFDNPFLDIKIRNSIESRKLTDPEWYRVYGEGLIGQYEGIVFRNWEVADLSKTVFDQYYYGLDFGYFPDPASFVKVAFKDDVVYVMSEIVTNKLENPQLASLLQPITNKDPVFCDSAEPKSIMELGHFINARPVKKGPDSRKFGISWLKGRKIVIDKSCVNLKKELSEFQRLKDRDGNILPLFQDGNDHSIDALRYALSIFILNRGPIKMERLMI